MNDFKPMLAATIEDPALLTFPVMVSPKLDGLRCIIRRYTAVSRNLKPFRNEWVQRQLKGLPEGLDGELIVGKPNEGHVLGRTQSGIMSADGEPDFTFHVFDRINEFYMPVGFITRYQRLETDLLGRNRVKLVPHYMANTLSDLLAFEKEFLEDGYEGIMVRHVHGKYKFGRSTLREGLLGKLKRFRDGEALVEKILEGVHNLNEATLDELGRTKRSNHQDNKVGANTIGTIVGKDLATGEILQISPGRMSHDDRKYYWQYPHEILGKIVKFKTFDYGKLDASRFCTFQAFRDAADMAT